MLGRLEDPGCIVHPDRLVDRRMKEEQGAIQGPDGLLHLRGGQVVQELFPDGERPAREGDARLAFGLDFLQRVVEEARHVLGVVRGRDGGHRIGTRDSLGRLQDRRPAQRMAHEDARRLAFLGQKLGGRRQIPDVRGEVGLREVALTFPQAGEVKPEHPDILTVEGPADGPDRA